MRCGMVELGAGSADKTRLLLTAAVDRQDTVFYEPVDVSASALVEAQMRIEDEIARACLCARACRIIPRIWNWIRRCLANGGWCSISDRASAILSRGESLMLLERVRAALIRAIALLLGVDLVKDEAVLQAAYDDAGGVTAAFNGICWCG